MSVRAQQVAEVMWELKQAEKLGTYTLIATRAGFTAGTNGRTMIGCMKKIRREWPHLEWWRAIEDSMLLKKNCEQVKELEKNGYEMEPAASDDKHVKPLELETHLVVWDVIDGVDETETAEEEAEETEEAVSK